MKDLPEDLNIEVKQQNQAANGNIKAKAAPGIAWVSNPDVMSE